jgi:hypothetical protein
MMKRSFFLMAACGLLASLAFSAPSQAGTIVTTTVSYGSLVPASTASVTEVDFTYTGAGTITNLSSFNDGALAYDSGTGGFFPVTAGLSFMAPDEVKLTFSPGATWFSGSFTFNSTTPYSTADTISVAYVTTPGGQSLTQDVLSFNNAGVPEPTSMALLGIGMTSFLAFRRFFKRNPVA